MGSLHNPLTLCCALSFESNPDCRHGTSSQRSIHVSKKPYKPWTPDTGRDTGDTRDETVERSVKLQCVAACHAFVSPLLMNFRCCLSALRRAADTRQRALVLPARLRAHRTAARCAGAVILESQRRPRAVRADCRHAAARVAPLMAHSAEVPTSMGSCR